MNRKRKGRGHYAPAQRKRFFSEQANRPPESSHTISTSTDVPREWQRCGEGFYLPVKDKSHGAVSSKPQKRFGQKWIQPEALLASSHSVKASVPEDKVKNEQEIDEAEILSNSSDSDSNEHPKKLTITSKQTNQNAQGRISSRVMTKTKRKGTARKRHARRRTGVQKENGSDTDSDTCDIVCVSDSGGENGRAADAEPCIKASTESSPVGDIECIGSPEGAHPETVDSSESDYDIQCKEDVNTSQQKAAAGGTPSISSCASSQKTADSDISPGPSGLRASEWAKHVNWQTTPTKQQTTSPSKEQGDSAKKKKKFRKGGLADQLSRIVLRDRSASRMWSHQQTSEGISQGASAKCISVTVMKLESVYSLHMARCTVTQSSLDTGVSSGQCLVLFSRHSTQTPWKIQPGAVVTIFPPWQQLDTEAGKEKMLLCTRYQVVSTASSRHHPNMEDSAVTDMENTSISPSPAAHARWMCPCLKDAGLMPSRCPAQLFPVVPPCLLQPSLLESQGKTLCAGKTLFTVTCNERVPKRVLTFHTLLESIEESHTGDKLLPSFQATVLRVFTERVDDTNDLRHELLVEDSHGTVALIQGGDDSLTTASQDLEGRTCCFSQLRVQSRANRDRDPALFSAIEAAWCRNVKTAHSQESGSMKMAHSEMSGNVHHSDDSLAPSQRNIQPPAFCYILAANDAVCEALSRMDTVTVDSSQAAEPPSLGLQTIASVLQSPHQSSRVSLVGKVIYTAQNMDGHTPSQSDSSINFELFVTDHTCGAGDLPVSPDEHRAGYVKVCVRPGCVTDHVKISKNGGDTPPYLALLRDIWIVAGTWIADKYSQLWSLSAEREKARILMEKVDEKLLESVRECRPSLAPVTRTTPVNSLTYISGVIQSVDEKSAFSWDECDSCGSDKLGTRCSTGTLVCMGCRKEVTCPVQRMKMDVLVACDADRSITVKISLQQSTIQQLLPEEADEEGYDVDCVLSKHLGPVNCVITTATRTSSSSLQLTAKELVS